MKKLKQLFNKKSQNILSIFTTAGYPELNATVQTVLDLDKAGVDLVELGIPFSDPMADGPTIQESSEIALANGMNLNILFEQVQEIRKTSDIPIVLMGYINPIFQFGIEAFLKKCVECGVDGLIVPDISVEIYQKDYENLFKAYGIPLIFLITPQTSAERINKIDILSQSFIYLVSTASVTGSAGAFSKEQVQHFDRISKLGIKAPVLVGFGIHNAQTFDEVCRYFDGAIIGSAFLRSWGDGRRVGEFVDELRPR